MMRLLERMRGRFGPNSANTAGRPPWGTGRGGAADPPLEDSRELWYAMYRNRPPWAGCDVRPLGLPGAIGRELSRHALAEFEAAVSGSARAEFLNDQLSRASDRFGDALEKGLCLGGAALRPYPDWDKNRLLVKVCAGSFTPTQLDAGGNVVGGVFMDGPVWNGSQWLVRLERHGFQEESGLYCVENQAFLSGPEGFTGAEAPLDAVPQWAGLSPRVYVEGLNGPLFAYFNPPFPNRDDPESPLGASVYAGAVKDLIRQADEQWERIWWEFESGERKIFSDAAQIAPGQLSDRLFLKGMFTSGGNLFEQFSPQLRNSSLYEGFQYILKLIEFNVGLAFGTLSDPDSVNKTATEELMTKHRQYVTEGAIQRAFQTALEDLVRAMDALCSLYRLAPAGDWRLDCRWGDGILDDPDTRRKNIELGLRLLEAGVSSPLEFRMSCLGEDEAAARAMLPGQQPS